MSVVLSNAKSIQAAAERYQEHQLAQGIIVTTAAAVQFVTEVERQGMDRYVAKKTLELIDQHEAAGRTLSLEAAVATVGKQIGSW